MGVLCLILDRKKQYHLLLADIFTVTGHKLLSAFDENRALELLRVSSPQVLLLEMEDLPFWLKITESGIYTIPLLFIRSYEEAEVLKNYGLTELNSMVLPFNPIELLERVVLLSKPPAEVLSLSQEGPTNVLIKVLKAGASSIMKIEHSEGVCRLYISKGIVKGSSCAPEELYKAFREYNSLELEPYDEAHADIRYFFKNNMDFFQNVIAPALEKEEEKVMEEEVLPTPVIERALIDLSQPIEIAEGFYWVGVSSEYGIIQKNAYLRIYEGNGIKLPVLINTFGTQEYPLIRAKLEQITGTIDALRAVIVFGSNLGEASGLVNLLQANPRAFVITSVGIAVALASIGIPINRIRTIETFPNHTLKLATGHSLKFIPVPYMPEKSSFMLFEGNTRRLFTGKFLSSLCTQYELNPLEGGAVEDVLIYTSQMAPDRASLKRALEALSKELPSSIYPAFGNPLLSVEKIEGLINRLQVMPLYAEQKDTLEPAILMDMLSRIIERLKKELKPAEYNSFMEDLQQYAYMEDGRIIESFVEVKELPSLIVALMLTKGVNPAVLKEVYKELSLAGISLPTI